MCFALSSESPQILHYYISSYAKMCARLLACPLCSQPGFVTLDALRAGLVSVATRPLTCPVCNETLLGIDKLTIHLFGHTISANDKSDSHRHINRKNGTNVLDCAPILPHKWEIGSAQTVVTNGLNHEEAIGEKITFAPISNVNGTSCQSIRAVVINQDASDSQGCSRLSGTASKKNQTDVTFVHNSGQQHKFSSPRSINNDNSTNISNGKVYRVPITLDNLPGNERTLSGSLHNSQEQSPLQCTSGSVCLKSVEKNSGTAHREEIINDLTDTWLENLLHEDGRKCSERVSSREEKGQYSIDSEGISNLTILPKEDKYCPSTSAQNIDTNILNNAQQLNGINSSNSIVRTAEEILDTNQQSNFNAKGLLPQWKAFRLLAMKEKSERCDICGIHFPDTNFLVLHKQLAHMISEKDANAKPEELLKNCPCHLCTKVFKTRGTLMVHMRVAHMGYNLGFLSKDKDSESLCCENGFNCPTCGKNFKKEQHVTQHLKTHEGKQWECDVCSKMFTTKYFLKKHKRLHSGEMPYKCTICDKTFTFQQSYHKHRLYHKDDKPHTCTTCGRSFKELSTLHNHERIHTGEKPFVCETCGKCFRQRVSYLVHRRIHTGVMPYKCTLCGKSFRYKVSQRTHKCPVQSEDPGIPQVAEASTGETDLSSNCVDRSTNPKPEILLQNYSEPNENNKFILIVNTQGQPILTREADVSAASNYLNEKRCIEPMDRKENPSDNNNLWNNNSPTENVPVEEKLPTNDVNDFFSLVMSPMENDLSSPSTEMEHLRLSSPQNENREQCENSSESCSLQRDLNNAIEGIFQDNCTNNSPLQTINEESLKQLLYGIDRKV